MLKKILSGVSSGVLISIGGAVYLACENKYVGAVLFSVALLSICIKGYSLYTGKIGFLPEKHDKEAVSVLLWGLLGNLIGTLCGGILIRFGLPSLGEAAEALCSNKLTGQDVFSTLIRAFFCGILMYLAVSIYRDKQRVIGILFCIPVFILAGFEHSVADMFYFAAAGIVSVTSVLFILVVLLGNSLGGMLLPLLSGMWTSARKENGNAQ